MRGEGEDPLSAWLTGWYHPPCSVLWSRGAYEATGGWDPRATVNNDGDLVMRALADGAAMAFAERGCGYYRRLPGGQVSLSGKRSTRPGLTARLYVLHKLALRLEQAGRIQPRRAALAEAAWLIRREALPEHDDLAAEAAAFALTFGPGRVSRVMKRWTRRKRATDAAETTGAKLPVVHAGLDAAERVMREGVMEGGVMGGGDAATTQAGGAVDTTR